jgi:hypothetical protein
MPIESNDVPRGIPLESEEHVWIVHVGEHVASMRTMSEPDARMWGLYFKRQKPYAKVTIQHVIIHTHVTYDEPMEITDA